MEKLKKIALITSASNFERQKIIVSTISRKLKEIGGCTLYVFTCYGVFLGDKDNSYNIGAKTIYELIGEGFFDGCIVEGNIGEGEVLGEITDRLCKMKIPFVGIHFSMNDMPYYTLEGYSACSKMMKHLIEEHHCTKINMVAGYDGDVVTEQAIQAYRDILLEYGIPFEDKRIIQMFVSVQNGRDIFHIFRERGIEDAHALVCAHDVYAIGFCLEMEAHGYRVPEDIRICTLNRSTNSIVFRPELAGANRGDAELAEKACQGLFELMEGREIPRENYVAGQIHYDQSCGCPHKHSSREVGCRYQELILAKVEAGNQISRMMQYNDSLEEVQTLEELSANIGKMLKGINCKEYIFCLNSRTRKYIENETDSHIFKGGSAFDKNMIAMTGITERTGEIKNQLFSIENLVPFEPQEGDTLLFLPVHNQNRAFGYMVFVNEFLPINLYNYRICHESIGSSMENLRRQMSLKKSNNQLTELHMRDALTRLYNRFAWERFSVKYIENGNYCVVMLDMDGLKVINDRFGHLAGNHAINITANAIKSSIGDDDLLIRYGGDEFQILSHNMDMSYWENICIIINEKMETEVHHQKLPYELGISVGYCMCDEKNPISLEECCEQADKAMYRNKKMRYALKDLNKR